MMTILSLFPAESVAVIVTGNWPCILLLPL